MARTLVLAAVFGFATGCSKEPSPPSTPPPPPARVHVAPVPRAASGPSGAVLGRVTLSGQVPVRPPLATSASVVRQCGETVPDRSLVVAPDGALAYAVVSVADGATLPPRDPPPAPEVDQRRCAYVPPVVAALAGSTLVVLNSDPLIHNVRAVAGTSLFNVAMPLEGMRLKKPLPAAPATVALRCDVHPWMRATVKTFDHPFFTVTDEKGQYRLDSLPPGKHELVFWHEDLPERRVVVEVQANGTVQQDFTWSASDLHGA